MLIYYRVYNWDSERSRWSRILNEILNNLDNSNSNTLKYQLCKINFEMYWYQIIGDIYEPF